MSTLLFEVDARGLATHQQLRAASAALPEVRRPILQSRRLKTEFRGEQGRTRPDGQLRVLLACEKQVEPLDCP